MMTDFIDTGVRCDEHVGELFPPRCFDCGIANPDDVSATYATSRPRCGYIPGTECSTHAGYPLPCDRCAREQENHHD